MKHTDKARPCAITDPGVKPVSFTRTGLGIAVAAEGPRGLPDMVGETSFLAGLGPLSSHHHGPKRCSFACVDSTRLLGRAPAVSSGMFWRTEVRAWMANPSRAARPT